MKIRIEHGWLTVPEVYKYKYKNKTYLFEMHNYLGPTALRKDGEISKRIPQGFYNMYYKFIRLTREKQEKYRVV